VNKKKNALLPESRKKVRKVRPSAELPKNKKKDQKV